MPTSGGGNITNAPLFVDQAGGNLRLQTNSPCINAGNNSYVIGTTDLDGNLRIRGGIVDIGAYEYQFPDPFRVWLQQYGLPTDGSADYLDSDRDGLNNWQEWCCRTDPTNSLSVLQMLSVSNAGSGVTVRWQSVAGVMYFLECSTNLAATPPFTLLATNILGQAGTTSYADTNASVAGPFFYRVMVHLPPGNAPTYGNNGNPWTISASGVTRIEAENYDIGGEGVAYHDNDSGNDGGQYRNDDVDIEAVSDTGGGYDVGWIGSGEWLTYTITVPVAGTYNVTLRVARQPSGDGSVRVLFDGVDATGALDVPSTGAWQTWTSIAKTGVSLSAGLQVMRIEMLSDGFNINWIELSR